MHVPCNHVLLYLLCVCYTCDQCYHVFYSNYITVYPCLPTNPWSVYWLCYKCSLWLCILWCHIVLYICTYRQGSLVCWRVRGIPYPRSCPTAPAGNRSWPWWPPVVWLTAPLLSSWPSPHTSPYLLCLNFSTVKIHQSVRQMIYLTYQFSKLSI